jgi:tRNA-specific 2-thiouridylase
VAVGEPLFVVKIDADRRQVIVGPREALLTGALILKEINWLGDQPSIDQAARDGQAVLARVRSTREPRLARLAMVADQVQVQFDQAEEGVAPGQACVLYDPSTDGDRVLGGGFIASTVAAYSA